MSNTVMIMCAGLGTRLQPFTHCTAKPFLPVMGTPIVEYTICGLIKNGINEFIANIHHQPIESIKSLKKIEKNRNVKISISDERNCLLGSAGGIRKIIDQVFEENFFITNGDNLFNLNWNQLRERHNQLKKKKNTLITLVLKKNTTSQYYREIFFDEASGLITSLGVPVLEKYYYSGTCLADKETFAHLKKDESTDFVQDVLLTHIKNKKVGFFICDDYWIDIGSPSLWAQAHYSLMDLMDLKMAPTLWEEIVFSRNVSKNKGVWLERTAQIASKIILNPKIYLSGLIEGFDKIGPQVVGYGPAPKGMDKKIENCIFYKSNFEKFE